MVTSLLCAVFAALAYGTASVLQSVGVRRAGPDVQGAGLLVELKSQPLYFIGLALDGIGFVAVVIALQFLPLFLVQAIVAASVVVTAVISAVLGTRLGRTGWIAVGVTGIGLIMLGLSAVPAEGQHLSMGWRWLLLTMVVPIGLLALTGSQLLRRHRAPVLALAAGLGFTVVAVASRSLDLPPETWRLVLDPAFWAIVASGALAIVLFAFALQAGTVTPVSAVTFTTETVVPAVIGVAFLGDAVRDGYWPVAVTGLALAVIGAVSLAR